jgi:hypothetical protein
MRAVSGPRPGGGAVYALGRSGKPRRWRRSGTQPPTSRAPPPWSVTGRLPHQPPRPAAARDSRGSRCDRRGRIDRRSRVLPHLAGGYRRPGGHGDRSRIARAQRNRHTAGDHGASPIEHTGDGHLSGCHDVRSGPGGRSRRREGAERPGVRGYPAWRVPRRDPAVAARGRRSARCRAGGSLRGVRELQPRLRAPPNRRLHCRHTAAQCRRPARVEPARGRRDPTRVGVCEPGQLSGGGWIRTSDERIMSPLL